jgi:hypothetical protein
MGECHTTPNHPIIKRYGIKDFSIIRYELHKGRIVLLLLVVFSQVFIKTSLKSTSDRIKLFRVLHWTNKKLIFTL